MAWSVWCTIVEQLRPAFSRRRTFLWFLAALAAFAIREDLNGVTSFVRVLGLEPVFYHSLLRMFHSSAIDLPRLAELWTRAAMGLLSEHLVTVHGMPVFATDGVKVAKSGRKMPAVKTLHQESDSNTKPEYITGHSCQSVSLLVQRNGEAAAVPIGTSITEGVKFGGNDRRTIFDVTLSFLDDVNIGQAFLLLADAYYGCWKMARGCLRRGANLLTRVKSNAVAYLVPEIVPGRRGRPRIYGEKVRLRDTFKDADGWTEADIELYGERCHARYKSADLMWRPAGKLVRFVFVVLNGTSKCMFMSTDTRLDPLEIVHLYSLRFKIETGFKVAKHVTGGVLYHFWMMAMDRLGRHPKTQYLHRKSEHYRNMVRRKLRAYHCFLQAGVIAQGLMTAIGIVAPSFCWSNYTSWMRTMNTSRVPSEWVVQHVLRKSFRELLANASRMPDWVKFIAEKTGVDQLAEVA